MSVVFLGYSSPCFLNLELINPARLTGQDAPAILLSPYTPHWELQMHPAMPAFEVGTEGKRQAVTWLMPQPLSLFYVLPPTSQSTTD